MKSQLSIVRGGWRDKKNKTLLSVLIVPKSGLTLSDKSMV